MVRSHLCLRRGRDFILFLLLFSSCVFAGNGGYVFDEDRQLYPSSIPFINEISSEVFEKTGISIYLVALNTLANQTLDDYKAMVTEQMRKPYLYILFVRKEQKIDIDGSQDILQNINPKDIYWDYIVPLIPKKDSELTPSNISAFLVNGYLALIEDLTDALNIKLENKYVPQNKVTQSTTKIILYLMTIILLVLFLFFSLRKKSA